MWKEVKYIRKILEQPAHQRALGSCTEIQKDSTLELEGTLAMVQSTSLRQWLAQGHRTGPCQSKDWRNLETKLSFLLRCLKFCSSLVAVVARSLISPFTMTTTQQVVCNHIHKPCLLVLGHRRR